MNERMLLLKDLGAVRRGIIENQGDTLAIDEVMALIRRSPEDTPLDEFVQPLIDAKLLHFAGLIHNGTYSTMLARGK